jgi:hypothetical protein
MLDVGSDSTPIGADVRTGVENALAPMIAPAVSWRATVSVAAVAGSSACGASARWR